MTHDQVLAVVSAAVTILAIKALPQIKAKCWAPIEKKKRAREWGRRRENYEFLKGEIIKRHLNGYAALTVEFPGRKFDKIDMSCFKLPMYQIMWTTDMKFVIGWDRARMVHEVGTGAPLKEGEAMIQDTPGRSQPIKDVERIDEQKPLTIHVWPAQENAKDGASAQDPQEKLS